MIYILWILTAFWSFSSLYSIENMTLEEKVGQLLLPHFRGELANEESALLLEKAHVGGFILYGWSNTLSSPASVQNLTETLQTQNKKLGAKYPLFISVDQEGGRVNRLKSGFTEFPSEQVIGSTNLPLFAELVAKAIGEELQAVGININNAPVIDVNSNPKNPIIGNRAFSDQAEKVALFGEAALKGYQKTRVIAVIKHFPGHGDVSSDSHHTTPLVDKNLAELEKVELLPFRKLAPSAEALMTGHLLVKAIDPLNPATFSKKILGDLLRKQMGFQGIVISDSLVMKGLPGSSYEESALKALLAGCDLLCLGGKLLNEPTQDELTPKEVVAIHKFLVMAVREGRYPEEKLNQSVARIIALKKKYPLKTEIKLHGIDSVSTDAHILLKQEIELIAEIQKGLTKAVCNEIGQKIWMNECAGKVDGLVSWNAGEEFMSLGVGHFIWYPKGEKKVFKEAFPEYLAYLKQNQVSIPKSIAFLKSAPFETKEGFEKEKSSQKVEEIRKWLSETLDTQAHFIIERFFLSLHSILDQANQNEKQLLLRQISALAKTPGGLFAMIDYVNFKGDGLSEKERYGNQGWGLYQVLLQMPGQKEQNPLEKFQAAARKALEQRVANSPKDRNEARFLPGWLNRIKKFNF